jgi:thioredoxin 1
MVAGRTSCRRRPSLNRTAFRRTPDTTGALADMGTALEFTDDNFQSDVLNSPVPVLVDFWAPWCGPCRMIGPTIEELAVENAGSFRVGKVNVDDNGKLAMAYNVASIPTIMIFSGGKLVQQFMGVQPKAKLQQALDEAKSA